MKSYDTLKDAIGDVLAELNDGFSLHDITRKLREKLNANEITINGLSLKHSPAVPSSVFYDLSHAEVRAVFLLEFRQNYDERFSHLGYREFWLIKSAAVASIPDVTMAQDDWSNISIVPPQITAVPSLAKATADPYTTGLFCVQFKGSQFATRNGKAFWKRLSDAVQAFAVDYFADSMRGSENKGKRRKMLRELRKSGELEVIQRPVLRF